MNTLIRTRIDLNGIWDFQCETDDQPTKIQVPSYYSIQRTDKWAKFYWDVYGYPERWEEKGAVYRRSVTVTSEMLRQQILFVCEGCAYHSHIRINGIEAGESHDGYYPFSFPIRDLLKEGENTIEVEVEARAGDTNGGESAANRGIWKDVYLLCTSDLIVTGGHVETSVSEKWLSYERKLQNYASFPVHVLVRHRILDQEEQVVKATEWQPVTLNGQSSEIISGKISWENPHLWYPHDPYLYHFETQIVDLDGISLLDSHQIRFGFREISINGPHFYLNGQELFLRGHGDHYLGELQGTKEYAVAWLKALKEVGVNFMRMHVCPRHKVLYEAADEVGFLLEAEAAFHFTVPDNPAVWKDHIARMIEDQRNHPSVIMWSVSNELRWRGGGEKPALIEYARSLDKTRPVFASDFSGWSTHGDILGHHYNADTVFEEWEEFGPDKPMVWDELGNVWQPDRPLRNGTAGYEASSQDYATGLWRDGHDDALHDIAGMAQGKVFAGELHRVNAFIPWDFFYGFFRFQPLNWHRGIDCQWDTLEGPGLKPQYYKSCSSTLNIWDPCLPVYEPNPGYYFFAKYMKPIRFFGTPEQRECFGNSEICRIETLYYEDLRAADRMLCQVVSADGKTLTQTETVLSLRPGQVMEGVESRFVIPAVEIPTPVKLVREFSSNGVAGECVNESITIYPSSSESKKKFAAYHIGVASEEKALRQMLEKAGFCCISAEEASLIITEQDFSQWQGEIRQGKRVLSLQKGIQPDNCHPSLYLLLNGPEHRILKGIGQENLTFWKNCMDGVLVCDPYNGIRTIIGGEKDGQYAALTEQYCGEGACISTTIRLLETLDAHPAAATLLNNILEWLTEYQPEPSAPTFLLADSDWTEYFTEIGLKFHPYDPQKLKPSSLIIADCGCSDFTKLLSSPAELAILSDFVQNGGQIFLLNAGEDQISILSALTGRTLAIVPPYLGETSHCIKSAISWTRRDTPQKLAEYYEGVLIPQPFEPNYDPILAGISNWDLHMPGEKLFDNGIEIAGMNPVFASPDYRILFSNHRIDWSQPIYGGEYIQESKDIRRADWFINRTPVLFRVCKGKGSFLFCQLHLKDLGEAGKKLGAKILLNLHADFTEEFRMPSECQLFDASLQEKQYARFSKYLPNGKVYRCGKSIQTVENMLSLSDGNSLPRLLLLGGQFCDEIHDAIQSKLQDRFAVSQNSAVGYLRTIPQLKKNLYPILGQEPWQQICLFFGWEDYLSEDKKYYESHPLTASLKSDIRELCAILRTSGATIFWCSTPEIPSEEFSEINHDIQSRNQFIQQELEKTGAYIVDIAGYVSSTLKLKTAFSPDDWQVIANQIAEALLCFGV
ncbi:MAG: glycoside hydrolase family 2 TIM barrel-domain containing protein [Candidatus Merdivicinus sp.]|jgi:hypothetical protein